MVIGCEFRVGGGNRGSSLRKQKKELLEIGERGREVRESSEEG